jgi:lactoylglutathione lyase
MRLGYMIIYVHDVPSTVAFYERAFGLAPRFVHESGQYAELETGSTALAFANETFTPTRDAFEPNRPGAKAAGAEVGLVTEDVRAAFDRAVEAGAVEVLSPTQKPWGQTVSYVRDLNGFLVELCSPVGG